MKDVKWNFHLVEKARLSISESLLDEHGVEWRAGVHHILGGLRSLPHTRWTGFDPLASATIVPMIVATWSPWALMITQFSAIATMIRSWTGFAAATRPGR